MIGEFQLYRPKKLLDLGIIQLVPVTVGQRVGFSHRCCRFGDKQLCQLQAQCGSRAVGDVFQIRYNTINKLPKIRFYTNIPFRQRL